ncbi:MAG: carbohydrate porin [Pseudolabrys sp.]|nr:carbohydrate porin [Pseudolabrys sp.]MBV9956216.1 carbohydrate porin [Pseudolabrys sp.]
MARAWPAFVVVAALWSSAGAAQTMHNPDDDPDRYGIINPSIATSLPYRGDFNSARQRLSDRGITYVLNYTNDILANVSGGLRRGTINQGKLEAIFRADLEKLAGWSGLSFYANAFAIHNTGRIRRDYVGGINTIAAIEASPTVRLSELWLEQKILGDVASLRAGQLALDTEFFFSDTSLMFLQSDWPTITAQNLPSGGPAYPLSTPGLRLKVDPTKDVSLLFALVNGDPAGACAGDPDTCNRYGVNFRVNDPPLVMGEAQWRTNYGKTDAGLARQIKVGAWAHAGRFPDQRFASDGTSLANPASNGIAVMHRGDWGLYGVLDQQLYRPAGASPDGGISIFAIGSISPSNQNMIDAYLSGGIVFAGLIASRPDDRFGASFIHARFSDRLRAFDRDSILFGTGPGFVRDHETNLELSYVAQIVPGWVVQPNIQYVWHPSGRPGTHAQVIGLRTMLRY